MNPKCPHCGGNTYEISPDPIRFGTRADAPEGLLFRCFDCGAVSTSEDIMRCDY